MIYRIYSDYELDNRLICWHKLQVKKKWFIFSYWSTIKKFGDVLSEDCYCSVQKCEEHYNHYFKSDKTKLIK